MSDLKLVYPVKEYEEKAFEYIREFIEYNSEINGTGGLQRYDNYDEWLLKIEKDLDIPNIPEDRVPANTYFFVRTSDDKIIGMINIRHKLNEFLLNEGGHIGYSIRPAERNKGYGTEMLKLALVECQRLGFKEICLNCNDNNYDSQKVILNNGGIFLYNYGTSSRYKITL
jgi:predicted acetyltransferase